MPDGGPRRLILLRHGQTAYNLQRRIQGHLDIPLTETGHHQARAAAAHLAAELTAQRPVALWSSDLQRAAVTASYLAEATGLEVVHDERLREFCLGQRQGLSHPEYAARFPEEYAEFGAGRIDAAPGAESPDAVAERMGVALGELIGMTPAGGVAVAVGHGAALRQAIVALLGWPVEATLSLAPLGNCHWSVLEVPAHGGRPRLAAHNLSAKQAASSPAVDPDFTSRRRVG